MLSSAWFGEIGLLLDMVAFWILSWDLVRSMRAERLARDEILALERRAFNARYAVLAPGAEARQAQQEAFDSKQQKRVADSDKDMKQRRIWAWIAIVLTFVGFALQLYSGFPSVAG